MSPNAFFEDVEFSAIAEALDQNPAPPGTVAITFAIRNSGRYGFWFCPVSMVEAERRFAAQRRPTLFDPATAPAQLVMSRARRVGYRVRAAVGKGKHGRRAGASYSPARARKWAALWVGAGCPGAALQRHGHSLWRAARLPCDKSGCGIALYQPETDEIIVWLTPPPWRGDDWPLAEVAIYNDADESLAAAEALL